MATKASNRTTLSKAAERFAGALLGARRMVAGEWKGPGDVDLDGGWFLAQVKNTRIGERRRWGMQQIQEACKGTDKMPLLVEVDKPGRGGGETEVWVTVRWQDWTAWSGKGDVE